VGRKEPGRAFITDRKDLVSRQQTAGSWRKGPKKWGGLGRYGGLGKRRLGMGVM